MKISLTTAHPWHGISTGKNYPEYVNAFIEIVSGDSIKYEIDKESGWIKVDRPQKYSNVAPCLYGFIPQTYCKTNIKNLAIEAGCIQVLDGDKDPLDICVISSHDINKNAIITEVKPIGGFKMIDKNEADDKIIAVVKGDEMYGEWNDITDIPIAMLNKLKHYFLTYKNMPYENQQVKIDVIYNKVTALKVIQAAIIDYLELTKNN